MHLRENLIVSPFSFPPSIVFLHMMFSILYPAAITPPSIATIIFYIIYTPQRERERVRKEQSLLFYLCKAFDKISKIRIISLRKDRAQRVLSYHIMSDF